MQPYPPPGSWLVVACDGLFDELSDSACAELVRANAAQGPRAVAEQLRDAAYLLNSDDNVSVMAAMFVPDK